MDEKKDKGLQGNEKIEEAILALQQEPTEELLAHALTVVRRRMREQGQLIVAVEPPSADVQEAVTQAAGTAMRLQAVQTSDGKKWWSAFTGFEEELKGSGSVMSTFLTDMEQMAATGLEVMLKRISSSSARKGLYIVDGYVTEKGSVCEQFPEWRENGK